jgi:molybdenum cofactor cytidylyltransferase
VSPGRAEAPGATGFVGGLVLAAGAGRRFAASGGTASKLLAPLGGRPLLEHAIAAACAVEELERVVVVLGAGAEQIRARVDFGRAEPVVCPQWRRGQAWSLRCGVAALAGAARVIVVLGDEPLVGAGAIARLAAAPAPARAAYGGRPGHPVALGEQQLAAVRRLSGDHGARSLLHGARLVDCSDVGQDVDVDTTEDLEALADEARAIV